MAILKQTAKMIISEHAHRPITGRVLLTARQTVVPSEREVREYLKEFGIPARDIEIEYDVETRERGERFLSDRSFFKLFADVEVHSVDVTDYEGAQIIHDMNEPIPDSMRGQYDFIYNGSVMDNIFDASRFMLNCSDALASGGRIIHIEMATVLGRTYNLFTADWFHDYYALNKWTDCKVYYAQVKWRVVGETWKLRQLRPFQDKAMTVHKHCKLSSIWPQLVVCIAEKGEDSTSTKVPIQHQYRPKDEDWDVYYESFRRFANTQRHPKNFGRPTSHSWNFKRILRNLGYRPMLWSRSNCDYIQKL